MSTITILKIIESQNPALVQDIRDSITAQPICESIVEKVHAHVFLIYPSGDEFRDRIIFICSVLKIFSPETVIAECKMRNGVCKSMADKLNITQPAVSYYVKHVKHYYDSMVSIRDAVNGIVDRFGGSE